MIDLISGENCEIVVLDFAYWHCLALKLS